MAGWSALREGYDVNCDENCNDMLKLKSDAVNVVFMEEGKDDEEGLGVLRGLFDQALEVLLRGFKDKDTTRSVPALVGDGRAVDLFRLFYLVRERGGFNSVSKEKLWGLIAEGLDFDLKFSASLKLIYYKYLDGLDRWLSRIRKDGNFVKIGGEFDESLELLASALDKRFNGLSVESVDDAKLDKVDNVVIPAGGEKLYDVGIVYSDDYEKISKSGYRSAVRSDQGSFEEEPKNLEKESDDMQQMLSWLQEAATNPCIRRTPNRSGPNENDGKESLSLALKMRELMLKRKYPNLKDWGFTPNQKKRKFDVTIYDDPAPNQLEAVRFSKRVPGLTKTPRCSCCVSPSTQKNSHLSHCKLPRPKRDPEEPKKAKKTSVPPVSQPSKPTDGLFPDKRPVEKHVNVGPQYQAEIPPWTGEVSKEDCVQAGVIVWSPENQKQPCPEMQLGKGRSDICDCPLLGSVECVRFHTAENSMELKRELGRAFYQWKFDHMGEVVSLSWTPEEEDKFKSVMSSVALSVGKSYFRNKTIREFVDYYFNVFLLRKRCYQNRVTPNAADSDDELSEFGSVGGLYGHAASNASSSNPMICIQSEQCLEVDMPKAGGAGKFCE